MYYICRSVYRHGYKKHFPSAGGAGYEVRDKKWSVSSFKSLGSASIELTEDRISVLTGMNSSGKSSLIRSILVLCQSINCGDVIVLNGPLTKLGLPSDEIKDGAAGRKVMRNDIPSIRTTAAS